MAGLHAVFAPSSAATWLHCSFSALNAVPNPPKKQSTIEASDEGTRVHDVLQSWHFSGELPPPHVPEYAAAALWANFVEKLEAEGAQTEAEVQVRLTDDCWGTVDLRGRHPVISTIMDYKNGKWDVAAYHNAQMLSYAAMELEHNPAEWWRFVIFQPNGLDAENDETDKGFKQWVAHRSTVEAHKQRMLRAIADRSAPKPGPHCRWCDAFHTCPAMSQDAGFVMGAISRRPEDLTADELVRLLRLIRALGDIKEAYEDVLTARLKIGYQAEGATLKPQRSYRSYNDPVQAAEHMYRNYGPKGVKPVSPAQAEKLGPAGKQYVSIGTHKPPGELKVSY